MGWPSITAYPNIIKENLIMNTKITIDDVNRAEIIYGPATPLLQRRMTRDSLRVNRIEKVPFTLPISTHHRDVNLCIDFFQM